MEEDREAQLARVFRNVAKALDGNDLTNGEMVLILAALVCSQVHTDEEVRLSIEMLTEMIEEGVSAIASAHIH